MRDSICVMYTYPADEPEIAYPSIDDAICDIQKTWEEYIEKNSFQETHIIHIHKGEDHARAWLEIKLPNGKSVEAITFIMSIVPFKEVKNQ